MSEFIPSGIANPAPELSQPEQDAKTGSGLAIGSFVSLRKAHRDRGSTVPVAYPSIGKLLVDVSPVRNL